MGETTIGNLRDAAAGALALTSVEGFSTSRSGHHSSSLHGSLGGCRSKEGSRGGRRSREGSTRGTGDEVGTPKLGCGMEESAEQEDIITWDDVSVTYLPSMMEVRHFFVGSNISLSLSVFV